MATFTDDVSRLCGEIRTLRGERQRFLKELAHQAKERAEGVLQMRSGFIEARAEMARKLKAQLLGFTTKLRREVGSQARQFQADLTGARRSWSRNRKLGATN